MYKLEIISKKTYRYIDTKSNNSIEITLNQDPIIDYECKLSSTYLLENFDLLEYAIKDIKRRFTNLVYINNEYNEELEKRLDSLIKVSLYYCEIPNQETSDLKFKLNLVQDSISVHNYILAKLNQMCQLNSCHLGIKFKAYPLKIFEIEPEKYTFATLVKKGKIVGAVDYCIEETIKIRDIFADNKEYLEEIIKNLLTYDLKLNLNCTYVYTNLLNIIKKYNGKINTCYYIWKGKSKNEL